MKKETLEESCCTPIGQIKRYVDCVGCDRKSKQETIEEVAIRIEKIQREEWQGERSYSEEEVLVILHKRDMYEWEEENEILSVTDWFEQFKKK